MNPISRLSGHRGKSLKSACYGLRHPVSWRSDWSEFTQPRTTIIEVLCTMSVKLFELNKFDIAVHLWSHLPVRGLRARAHFRVRSPNACKFTLIKHCSKLRFHAVPPRRRRRPHSDTQRPLLFSSRNTVAAAASGIRAFQGKSKSHPRTNLPPF